MSKLLNKALSAICRAFGLVVMRPKVKEQCVVIDSNSQVVPSSVGRSAKKMNDMPSSELHDLAASLAGRVGRAAFHENVFCVADSPEETMRISRGLSEEARSWIEGFDEGDIFYDIGSNIGVFSLYVAAHTRGAVHSYAFEPSFVTYPSLVKNVAINNLSNAVTCFQVALSSETEIGCFNYHDLSPAGALHMLNSDTDYKGDKFLPVFRQNMLSFRLDDLVQMMKLNPPTQIKLDVDGIEEKVLAGAKGCLLSGLVKTVFVEIVTKNDKDKRPQEIVQFMSNCGYVVQGIFRHNNKKLFPGIDDYLFVQK